MDVAAATVEVAALIGENNAKGRNWSLEVIKQLDVLGAKNPRNLPTIFTIMQIHLES